MDSRKVIFIIIGSALAFVGFILISLQKPVWAGILIVVGVTNITLAIMGDKLKKSGNKKISEIQSTSKKSVDLNREEEIY